ncbi:hypothetical protein [Noviherbaspirillum sedimenti]|uniref:Carboxypeptidase regulatory-like domain-containing protein n=1 Tax=Noviherbaspirillum sedimenti TaxID=2320865 RepID=A0A3A3GJR8_9BURK|nr:hypothetical protein [Noviherbaspirillum sedimenti]RJG02556.1 hypothetical protein D3878_14045 [Noviherbaspirillum sedimenti]
MKAFRKTTIAAACAAACAAVLLTACGGGGGSTASTGGTGGTAPTVTISGTAAAGAALVGTVTVKDSTGKTKTVPIGPGGGYSVDVTDMTGPFVFRAEGSVGGRTYVIHSAATDATKTVNVTPLTDLIVANIAGQIAENFFDNPDAKKLTPATLAAQQTALRERLQTVLTALGVDAAVDLLHTQFTVNNTKLDAALDVLRVSVDPATNLATITNVITQEKIEDNLASTTDATKLTDTTNVATGLTDLQAIVATMKTFSDLFAAGLPEEAKILALLHTDFLHQDQLGANFAAEASGMPENVGIKFTNVELQSLVGDTAKVSFDVVDKNGVLEQHDRDFQLKKVGDKWLWLGNQSKLEVEQFAMSFQVHSNIQATTKTTGIEFWIEDLDGANSPAVSYAVVTGPGLPDAGVTLTKPGSGGSWFISGGSGLTNHNFYPITTDAAINSIPDNAVYTIIVRNGNNTVFATYEKKLPKRPYTHAEMATLAFPIITAPTLTQLAPYAGGTLNGIQGTVPANVKSVWAALLHNGNYVDGLFKAGEGKFGPFSLTLPSGASSGFRSVRVSYIDGFYREAITVHHVSN